MKRILLAAAGLVLGAQAATAQDADSVRMVDMEGVQVISTRASQRTPVAFTDVDRAQIAKQNFGQDLPFLLQTTPSVVVTSDAGAGIGYTSIRIRGTDATRINITSNGIPMNDAESHGMFWVNTPDFASSAQDIQVQRGVGTSTSGAGAFGGSINVKTESLSPVPFAELSGTYGSYNTHKETLRFGTGLLGGRWAFSGRLSNIGSDGYIDRASVSMKSYFAQGAYYGRNTVVKFITFGGKERTYHAWNGIDRDQMDADRRYNPSGEIMDVVRNADGTPVFKDDGKPKTTLGGYYKDQIDNYIQYNYQLHLTQRFSDRLSLNAALHYTDGDGYYEEYKNARWLVEYGLKPFLSAQPELEGYIDKNGYVNQSDLVRRKMMDNHFGGLVFSLDYNAPRLQATFGGAANRYVGDHFGRVLWVRNYPSYDEHRPENKYYDNKGKKNDVNFYAKATWQAVGDLYLFGDVQYRHIGYKIDGTNDRFDWNLMQNQPLAVNEKFDFINPKGGLMYEIIPGLNVYGSVAVAHKEPTRNNYTDSKTDVRPRAERLIDYEAGVNYRNGRFHAGANFYYMQYKDQLILTGELNHIGEPLADNIPDSYRTGVEVTAGVQITDWLRWDVNATFSANKIKDYTEYIDNLDENWDPIKVDGQKQTADYLGKRTISFSPSVIAGSLIAFEHRGWSAALQTNFVGKQYLTNSESDDLSLDAYFVNDLRVAYTFRLGSVRSLTLGVAVNNIFNEKYCSNGWGSSSLVHKADGTSYRSDYAGFFPQAETNVLASVSIRF